MAWKLAELFVEISGRMGGLTGVLAQAQGLLTTFGTRGARIGSQLSGSLLGPLTGIQGAESVADVVPRSRDRQRRP